MDLQPGEPLLGKPIDVVFIGSCTNGRLSDLRQAASVMKGRKVSPRVRMLVVPGSQEVKRQAEQEGLAKIFIDAGFEWREPGCSMCLAMNRGLIKVFMGSLSKQRTVPKEILNAEDRPILTDMGNGGERFEYALSAARISEKIVIIPGYGMALAQAQFQVVRLAHRLEELGKKVKFAIHPVAGRMPGHMNVLLAEAEVDYENLVEMEAINSEFPSTDLALIVGACDVVNPAAVSQEGTPISGMPILMAHEAKLVVVCNMDGKPGYSGVKNPLYDMAKTITLFGDAKETLARLLEAL